MNAMTDPIPLTAGKRQRRVLLVDDDRSSLLVLSGMLESLGYAVETAENGAEAFTMMREDAQRADIVVTDFMMPVMDGVGLTRSLKRADATRNIPVVMLTGANSDDDMSAGIAAGVFYYLTKPPVRGLVTSVMNSALQEVERNERVRNELGSHQSAFRNMEIARFRLRLPDEVDGVVSLMASLHHEPDAAIQGIYELVQNAVEHGVLRFGLKEKTRLLAEGGWDEALKARAHDPRYAKGVVEATAMRRKGGTLFVVKDNGPGFTWKPFLASDPARAAARCGRGIARAANYSFDRLVYNESGNQVAGFLAGEARVVW